MTLLPEQIVLSASLDAMVTLAGRFELTVVTILSDTAGDPVAQVAFEVICTVTVSLFARMVVVYEMLSVPTDVVPTNHW